MKRLRIGVIDLVAPRPGGSMWSRLMNASFASVMPQAISVWCEEGGHHVTYVCYTGAEDLATCLPSDVDFAFIGAFTEASHLAYALSAFLRSRGAITALGGPHARCFPQDAQRYFDYVFGFTDKDAIQAVLEDCSQHRPLGTRVSAAGQPPSLPGIQERWKFIDATLRKAPIIKVVPVIGSLGCPYKCSFCIDSTVPYQQLSFDLLKSDLSFLRGKFHRPLVGWHDPNFGVLFNETMDAIEEAVPPGSIDFVAESSLSLLTDPHLRRLKRNSFKMLLPGIESWFALGEKSRTMRITGADKVREVSAHVNTLLRHVPLVQTNFVLGLDSDEGEEPFELTKRFVDLAPGAFPGYSLLTAFGQAAPLNLEYQREGRVIPFPFHFLNNNGAMNLKPKNYSWTSFYDKVISLTEYTCSPRAIARRAASTRGFTPRWLNTLRAVSSEGYGRIRFFREIRRRLDTDMGFRDFFEQRTGVVPRFYVDRIQRELGSMWHWLPAGGTDHDPYAYLKDEQEKQRLSQSSVPPLKRAAM
ncbi:MAG TPA: radical SAM protein [Bacteroidota bacterium]|nr:radical SAM protein [Bacteroidota bacterium]